MTRAGAIKAAKTRRRKADKKLAKDLLDMADNMAMSSDMNFRRLAAGVYKDTLTPKQRHQAVSLLKRAAVLLHALFESAEDVQGIS